MHAIRSSAGICMVGVPASVSVDTRTYVVEEILIRSPALHACRHQLQPAMDTVWCAHACAAPANCGYGSLSFIHIYGYSCFRIKENRFLPKKKGYAIYLTKKKSTIHFFFFFFFQLYLLLIFLPPSPPPLPLASPHPYRLLTARLAASSLSCKG